jgi:hypothetical protein
VTPIEAKEDEMAALPFWGNENVMQSLGLSPDLLA